MSTPQNTRSRKPQAEATPDTKDDITFKWNVSVVRGKNTPLANLQGSSTMHQMLADNMVLQSPSRAEQEMNDKITLPLLSIIQGVMQQMILDRSEAK